MKRLYVALFATLLLVLGMTPAQSAPAVGHTDNYRMTARCNMGPYSIYPFTGKAKVYMRVYSDGRDTIIWTRPHAAPTYWQPGAPGQKAWTFATMTFDGAYPRHYNDPWYAWHDRYTHTIRIWWTNGTEHKHCTMKVHM